MSGKESSVFSIDANEEFYQEGNEVVAFYIFVDQGSGQSWIQGSIHTHGSGFRFRDGSGWITCDGM